jgi:drug/metabolite transporter (DMT)-like permease
MNALIKNTRLNVEMSQAKPSPAFATFIGSTAVLMWATLALFTTMTGKIPPFQLTAMTFSVAFVLSSIKWAFSGKSALLALRQPWPVWAFGIGGLFGYHLFYFLALKNAPPVEAGLIAYMWPLLIVVCSALLPGEKLRWYHVAGGSVGFAGTIILVLGGKSGGWGFDAQYAFGYAMAALCAITWTSYSLISRRFGDVPTDVVGGFCGATAVLSLLCHLMFEQTLWLTTTGEWLAVVALGIGPVGLAFFVWDYGVKNGNIQALGASSYAAPLLSTILLIVFGFGEFSWNVGLACMMIVGGAVLASKDLLHKR